jgi:biotin transporter BioY
MGKCAGYLWAFPVAAYGMARWRVKMGNFLALSLGKSFVLFCGFLWLIPFVGTSVAWKQGLLVFVPCELVKILAASALIKWRQK